MRKTQTVKVLNPIFDLYKTKLCIRWDTSFDTLLESHSKFAENQTENTAVGDVVSPAFGDAWMRIFEKRPVDDYLREESLPGKLAVVRGVVMKRSDAPEVAVF
ncbi:hypothetical protein FPHYL_7654 [Fusarium phyllophilum]|uniref:Uncharacterized protein n=1 Tax=Fusarium phyllophilum TaxID=47803 RepID=A0A8H5JMM9_9HYPO|nr:hypothetical protein FPHYL_7654 [Fusarium phyllophilum]